MVDSRWRRHRCAALKLFRREVLTGFGLLVGKTVIVCVCALARTCILRVHNSIVYNAHTYTFYLSHSLSSAVHRAHTESQAPSAEGFTLFVGIGHGEVVWRRHPPPTLTRNGLFIALLLRSGVYSDGRRFGLAGYALQDRKG